MLNTGQNDEESPSLLQTRLATGDDSSTEAGKINKKASEWSEAFNFLKYPADSRL